MACPVVVIWGKNGAGKTTVAANLACALADFQKMVGLLSSNLYFGELQTHLNCKISTGQGSHLALASQTEAQSFFVKSGVNSNLFLLAAPNECNASDQCEQDAQEVESLIQRARIPFDLLVIDGSADLQNALTYIGMMAASTIVSVYQPSIVTCLWHQAHTQLFSQLRIRDRQLHVLNADNAACDRGAVLKVLGIKLGYELPFVPNAPIYENIGTPIVYQKDKPSQKYAKAMRQIAAEIATRIAPTRLGGYSPIKN
jgi:MinD-like ATPase involved in chromosome partitioning or flagellar assembly